MKQWVDSYYYTFCLFLFIYIQKNINNTYNKVYINILILLCGGDWEKSQANIRYIANSNKKPAYKSSIDFI